MNRTALTFAAIVTLGFGTAACANEAAAPETAAPAAEAPAPDANAAAPDAATAPDAAAPADTAAPAADMATAEPAPAPTPAQNTNQMMRDVRLGAKAAYKCSRIDNVTVDGFDKCVADVLSDAEAKGTGTESYRLGVDYRAWTYLGEHAEDMREKGMEWSQQYRQAHQIRETYRKNAADLLDKTGLGEKKVCGAIDASGCPE